MVCGSDCVMGINYKTETHQAKKPFPLVNPGKYKSSRPPMFKSGWEAEVFRAMDINPFVLEWGYEPFPIYYHHPFYMNYTIYWPDIYAHIQMNSGVQQKLLIEIKPAKFCVMPKAPKPPKGNDPKKWDRYRKSMVRFTSAQKDYMVNKAKWEAASLWCLKNNFVWRILNEENSTSLFKS